MDRSITRFENYSAFETGLECAVTRRIGTALIQAENDLMTIMIVIAAAAVVMSVMLAITKKAA